MNLKTTFFSLFFCLIALYAVGQVGYMNGNYYPSSITVSGLSPMCALNSGKVTTLDNAHDIAIEYDYSELKVGMNMDEPEFLTKMAEELNKKKPGQGDNIKNSWEGFKKHDYEPVFVASFNQMAQESELDMKGTNYAKEKSHTMLVKVVSIAPGSVTRSGKPAIVDLECIFKDNQGTELCKFYIKNMIADDRKFGPEVNQRIAHCFHKAAIMLSERIAAERRKAEKKRNR